jgi:hypothetical protein
MADLVWPKHHLFHIIFQKSSTKGFFFSKWDRSLNELDLLVVYVFDNQSVN